MKLIGSFDRSCDFSLAEISQKLPNIRTHPIIAGVVKGAKNENTARE